MKDSDDRYLLEQVLSSVVSTEELKEQARETVILTCQKYLEAQEALLRELENKERRLLADILMKGVDTSHPLYPLALYFISISDRFLRKESLGVEEHITLTYYANREDKLAIRLNDMIGSTNIRISIITEDNPGSSDIERIAMARERCANVLRIVGYAKSYLDRAKRLI